MIYLTPRIVRTVIRKFKFIDRKIDFDEPHKAILHLNEGWTWNALDGNRSVEGFVLCNNLYEEPDTLDYLLERISMIEPVAH